MVPLRLLGVLLMGVGVGHVTAMPAPNSLATSDQRPATRSASDTLLPRLRTEVLADVERMHRQAQQMIDMLFSFGELGYHEVESSRYLVDLLRRNGFTVTEGIAGMPTRGGAEP